MLALSRGKATTRLSVPAATTGPLVINTGWTTRNGEYDQWVLSGSSGRTRMLASATCAIELIMAKEGVEATLLLSLYGGMGEGTTASDGVTWRWLPVLSS